jgi:hypothetical protein
VAAAGPQSDTVRFVEYIQRNIALNEFRTGLKMSVAAAAAYVRTELAAALRKAPYQANLLIGGCDASGPSLVFMDYLASCAWWRRLRALARRAAPRRAAADPRPRAAARAPLSQLRPSTTARRATRATL